MIGRALHALDAAIRDRACMAMLTLCQGGTPSTVELVCLGWALRLTRWDKRNEGRA